MDWQAAAYMDVGGRELRALEYGGVAGVRFTRAGRFAAHSLQSVLAAGIGLFT